VVAGGFGKLGAAADERVLGERRARFDAVGESGGKRCVAERERGA
jgi:hypothetical protein